MNEYIFTFGQGHPLKGRCVRIKGTYGEAREKMCAKFGLNWAFQYSAEEWERFRNDPNRWWPMEEEIDLEGDVYIETD